MTERRAGRGGDGRHVVLLGAGHANVQVLRILGGRPDVRVTLVNDGPAAVYSGMLPGCVAGLYEPEEIAIGLDPLCRSAGAELVDGRAEAIDPGAGEIRLAGGSVVSYDVLAINVGSVPRGLDVPGVAEHAVPTRPIAAFVERLAAVEAGLPGPEMADRGGPRVVVVGAGAAGVELAFALDARYRRRGWLPDVTIVEGGDQILGGRDEKLVDLAHRLLTERTIRLATGARVERVDAEGVHLENGRVLPQDIVVWATGAAAPPWLRKTGLALDGQGFVKVSEHLQAHAASVYAAGDCAALRGWPDLPKAGVYPVRQGPVLAGNLLESLRGAPQERYHPQKGFLALLMTGDGGAIFSWRGLALHGRWAWRLKDRIDRRWMRRYHVEDGT